MIEVLFCYHGMAYQSVQFWESSCITNLNTISLKNDTLVYLKQFVSVKLYIFLTADLHDSLICHGLCHQHYTLHSKHHLQCQIYWADPSISLLFLTEICHLVLTLQMVVLQTCNCQNYLQSWLDMIISASIRIWWPKLASISVRYHAFVRVGYISMLVWTMCTGLLSAWLSLVGSKHM